LCKIVKIKLRFTSDVPVHRRQEYVQAMEKLGARRVGNSFSFIIEEHLLREALGLKARKCGSTPPPLERPRTARRRDI